MDNAFYQEREGCNIPVKGSNPKPRYKHISPLTYPEKEVTVESWAKQQHL